MSSNLSLPLVVLAVAVNGCALSSEDEVSSDMSLSPDFDMEIQSGGSGDPSQLVITGGWAFSCGMAAGGTAKCWGNNGSGELGTGKTYGQLSLSSTPVSVMSAPGSTTPITDVIDLATGLGHGCVLLADHTLKCWGRNSYGELGDGSATPSNQNGPVSVVGLSDVTKVTGGHYFTCAVNSIGEVFCWGTNYHGELGQGINGPPTSNHAPHSTPLKVTLAGPAVDIEAGQSHVCALLATGRVQCWGRGDSGQLGNGDLNYNNYYIWTTPVYVASLFDAVKLRAGDEHTCALRTDGTAVCWGSNYSGQLGIGIEPVSKIRSVSPMPVVTTAGGNVPFSNITSLSAGGSHTCALRADGQAFCWGLGNTGQLGNGESAYATRSTFPVNVLISGTAASNPVPLEGVATIGVGRYQTCAIMLDGSGRCWGSNGNGELGNGAPPWGAGQNHPVTVLQYP